MRITIKENELKGIILDHLKKCGLDIDGIELGRDDEYDGFIALDNIQAKVTIDDPYRDQILCCNDCVITMRISYPPAEIQICPVCGQDNFTLVDAEEDDE